ncbi:MAG: transposase [Planctomycetes bacterium]|nr:transposase [Planctomycetota bacterium]
MIRYAWKNWRALTRYAEVGRLNIDNNPAERALRPAAVGRKNWLFARNKVGGDCAAIMNCILYTCKRNRINPFEYLKDVLDRIPSHPATDSGNSRRAAGRNPEKRNCRH